jgi:hypothetical protein
VKEKLLQLWKSLPPKRRRIVKWGAWILVFYTVAGFFLLPLVVRTVAVKRLSRELNREVTIQSLRMNPYALSCSINGLLIKDHDGQPFVSWDKVYVNFQVASFFGHAWVFKEFSTTNTYVRVQLNKDSTFNFSDLLDKFSKGGAPSKPASRPMALRIDKLRIGGARASLKDLSPREAFERRIGPLEITLNGFRTDPSNKNPYSFTGSTESGEVFSWSGYFFLNPIRAAGELSVANVALNKYAPLYQDLVRFQILDGIASFRGGYEFVKTPTTNTILVTNVSAALRALKISQPGALDGLVEMAGFTVSGLNGDLIRRNVEIGSLTVTGAVVNLRRSKDASINLVEMAKPAATATNTPGGILVLLRAITNAFSIVLSSTNSGTATLHNLSVENCSATLEDQINSRPARLVLDQINLSASNLSNLPRTNSSARASLRWNTNGSVKTEITAAAIPLSADIKLVMDQIELRPLDPYLEPYLNLFIIGSKLSLDGEVKLRTEGSALPVVTFAGSSSLDDFATVDGVMGEDLIKWASVRFSGIEANLQPPAVSVAKVHLQDAFARLTVETNRTLNLLAAIQPMTTNSAAPIVPAKTEKTGSKTGKKGLSQIKEVMSQTNAFGITNLLKLNVGAVVISNADLELSDRSMTPRAQLSVRAINGEIRDISSDELRNARIHLQARVNNASPVEITGKFSPLHQQASSEIKIVCKDIDLNPTDPYIEKFLGYRFRKGKLSTELSYQVSARNLKGRNVVRLDQFTLGEKVPSQDATRLPVKLGLALLKDRNGKIELDVPVEGNLDDPKFRLGGVIWGAVLNVFTKIVTSPFAALGSLFGGSGEEVSYQEFTPGDSELQPAAREKLDALAKALYERPGLEVEIEGNAHPKSDSDALRRLKLEQQLRLQKWTSLRKSEQASTSPQQIVLSPEDRARFLAELMLKLPAPEAPGNEGSKAPREKARGRLLSVAPEKGAEALLRPQPTAEERQALISNNERSLLDSITIEGSELEALASARAGQVQKYLNESRQIDAGRLFLTEAGKASTATNGHRVYLHLR